MQIKTVPCFSKTHLLTNKTLYCCVLAVLGYFLSVGFALVIPKNLKKFPVNRNYLLNLLITMLQIFIFTTGSVLLYRTCKSNLLSKTQVKGDQKRNLDKNGDLPIDFILLNIDKDVPDRLNLMDIQKNVIQELENILKIILEEMCVTTKLLFTGSSAEQFKIPVLSLHIKNAFVKDKDSQLALITGCDSMIGDKYFHANFDSAKD